MNREQKAAVVDEVADQIKGADAIFAIDYRGTSVKQAMDLRRQLSEAGAKFQIVKNRLTVRAADKAGAEDLKQLLEGPTAFAFVAGDPAVAAKAVATFRRQSGLLEFKGGTMAGEFLTTEQLDAIARVSRICADAIGGGHLVHLFGTGHSRIPVEEMFPRYGSFPGFHPIVELSLTYHTQVVGANEEPEEPAPADEAPGDAVAEAETAEQEQEQEQETETSEAPSEGGDTEPEEG